MVRETSVRAAVSVRAAAVAGLFYPGTAQELDGALDDCFDQCDKSRAAPKALIVPHAGYVYSGPVADCAFARLATARDSVTRVVLLGPAHRMAFPGLAASIASAFATPLGEVPVDAEAIDRIAGLPQVRLSDAPHHGEHSLEVQLPFLQRMLAGFALVPLVVGDATPEEVAEVIDALWGGPETLIVVSSDLSHYHGYDKARRLDAATSHAIEMLRPNDIGPEQACGRLPIQGLLRVIRDRGLGVTTLDLRNSGDVAGARAEVVGYGAWAFA